MNIPINVSGCVIVLVAVSTLERGQESLGGEVEVTSGADWQVWRWLHDSKYETSALKNSLWCFFFFLIHSQPIKGPLIMAPNYQILHENG